MDSAWATKPNAEGPKLPEDCLGHDDIARLVLDKVGILSPGSMISIQGPWGRGKTDILLRIKGADNDSVKSKARRTSIWINPWQYGTPDLLSPIVIALLKLAPPKTPSQSKALWKAAQSVITAGIGFGLKATALVAPGGKFIEAAAEEAKSLLTGLFEARALDEMPKPDPDPVARLGEQFKKLVDHVLAHEGHSPAARLLICIDDLDRCLPHRQVALLEALHFLISAKADATILVALDPSLARQSVVVHYGTPAFDPERYLDKMFDLRITLPSISGETLKTLIRKQLSKNYLFEGAQVPLLELAARRFGHLFSDLENSFQKALFLPDFCNPRMIGRILRRIHLLACSNVSSSLQVAPQDQWLLILWLALIERRPELRTAYQGTATTKQKKDLHDRLRDAYKFAAPVYEHEPPTFPGREGYKPPKRTLVVAGEEQPKSDSDMRSIGMPAREHAPDLVKVFEEMDNLWSETHKDLDRDARQSLLIETFSAFDDLLLRACL